MGDDGRLLDIVEVNIARGDAVDGDGDGGDAAHEKQLLVARADDARVEERLDRLLEAGGGAVGRPVGGVEDGAAVPLGLGQGLGF